MEGKIMKYLEINQTYHAPLHNHVLELLSRKFHRHAPLALDPIQTPKHSMPRKEKTKGMEVYRHFEPDRVHERVLASVHHCNLTLDIPVTPPLIPP